MPTNIIKSFSQKSGKTEKEVEKLWDKAKDIAKEQDHEEDYPYIVGILKKMLGIKESYITFERYLKEEEQTYIPPDNVSKEAKKAIDYKEKYKDEVTGGTQIGWTRANQLANKENISLDTVKRMYSFFSRHKGNEVVKDKFKDKPWKDNGYIAWLIWGGDPGFKWVKDILNKD